jgi:hypothetical protein
MLPSCLSDFAPLREIIRFPVAASSVLGFRGEKVYGLFALILGDMKRRTH